MRQFYDDDSSRRFSYDHFKRNHGQLLNAVAEGWPAQEMSIEYGSPDHLTRACFEADVHRFGYGKTQFQVLRLNQLVKDSQDFASFKAEASKLLTNLNERHLKTEFDTAKATANATANVLRAVADGAKFMRHKATQDTHTRPVHAALHNKVWRIDNPQDTEWRRFVVPLGFGCRCHDIFEDEADTADLITNEDAERLIGPDEVKRLTEDGFLLDRVDKKSLFSQRQSYLNGLQDPEQVAYQMGQMKFADQQQQPWAQLNKTKLPQLSVTQQSKADALADFATRQQGATEFCTDYAGRPLYLKQQDLDEHLEPKYLTPKENRQSLYFKIAEVVADPDEVYFHDYKKAGAAPLDFLSYTYLKFYQNDVLLVAVEFSQDQPQSIKTWYSVFQPDTRRNGLLVHKK